MHHVYDLSRTTYPKKVMNYCVLIKGHLEKFSPVFALSLLGCLLWTRLLSIDYLHGTARHAHTNKNEMNVGVAVIKKSGWTKNLTQELGESIEISGRREGRYKYWKIHSHSWNTTRQGYLKLSKVVLFFYMYIKRSVPLWVGPDVGHLTAPITTCYV